MTTHRKETTYKGEDSFWFSVSELSAYQGREGRANRSQDSNRKQRRRDAGLTRAKSASKDAIPAGTYFFHKVSPLLFTVFHD